MEISFELFEKVFRELMSEERVRNSLEATIPWWISYVYLKDLFKKYASKIVRDYVIEHRGELLEFITGPIREGRVET